MDNIQQILEHVMDIKQDIGGLRQSYAGISNVVCANTKNIEKNSIKIINTDLVMSRWLGGISVLLVIVNIASYYFFN